MKQYILNRHKVNTTTHPPYKPGFPQPELSTEADPRDSQVSTEGPHSSVGRSSLGCGKVAVNLDTALRLIELGITQAQERRAVKLSAEQAGANEEASTLLDYRNTRFERKDQDVYKYARIISGSVIEDYVYEKVQGRGKVTNPEGIKAKEHTEESFVQALIKAGNLAKKEIRRIVNSNVGRWGSHSPKFFTITFAENIQDQKAANYQFTQFIKRLNWNVYKSKKLLLKYTVVIQYQDRGAIHWHVIFYNLPLIPVNQEYQKRWSSWCKYDFNLSDLWGQGFVKINRIDSVDNVGAYVASYVGNEKDSEHRGSGGRFVDPRYFNQKRFFCSKGLLRPKVIKSLSPLPDIEQEPVYQTLYTNEYTGTVEYKQYNPGRRKTHISVDKENEPMIERRNYEKGKEESNSQYHSGSGTS